MTFFFPTYLAEEWFLPFTTHTENKLKLMQLQPASVHPAIFGLRLSLEHARRLGQARKRSTCSFVSFTPAREGKGISTICGAAFAFLIAFEPVLSVVDCDPFPGANFVQGTSRYDAIFTFVVSLIHEGIWLAGMSCEAEEGAEFLCVDPARWLTSRIFFSVLCFVTPPFPVSPS